MSDNLSKIMGLIQRAAHAQTPEQEARTAGVIACKLMVEHKCLPGQVSDNSFLRMALERASREIQEQCNRANYLEVELKKLQDKYNNVAAVGSQRRKTFKSKYAGTCKECNQRYEVGDLISWCHGAPTLHESCARKRAA